MSPFGALGALESELRLRIAALRDDAAAMLNDLEATGPDEETAQASDDDGSAGEDSECDSVSAVPLASSRLSNVGASSQALAAEQALEVATSLGVDTDQSEERIAKKCRMLSLRVKWGGVARFCMLPVTVTFESLAAEVSRRFGLAHGAALPQLSWREAQDLFSLTSQSDWEECLQRRGLVAQPGRLELLVEGDAPPPVPRPRQHVYGTASSGFGLTAAQSPLAHQRPELFTWRVTDRLPPAHLWATRRGACRTRAGARSPPTTGAALALARGQVPLEELPCVEEGGSGTLKARKRDQLDATKRAQETMLSTSASGAALVAYGGAAASRPRSSALGLGQPPTRPPRSMTDGRGLTTGPVQAAVPGSISELGPSTAGIRESSLGSAAGKARTRPLVQRGARATTERGDPLPLAAAVALPSRGSGKAEQVMQQGYSTQLLRGDRKKEEDKEPTSFHGALTGLDAMMQVNGKSVGLQ